MSTKQNYIGGLSGFLVALSVCFFGASHINDKKEALRLERVEVDINLSDILLEDTIRKNKQQSRVYDVSRWTRSLADMPESKERSAFAAGILKVIDDNTVTEEEHNALSNKHDLLVLTNLNERTKSNATKIRDGEDIIEYRSAMEQMRRHLKRY